jgi:hypothetical protein
LRGLLQTLGLNRDVAIRFVAASVSLQFSSSTTVLSGLSFAMSCARRLSGVRNKTDCVERVKQSVFDPGSHGSSKASHAKTGGKNL